MRRSTVAGDAREGATGRHAVPGSLPSTTPGPGVDPMSEPDILPIPDRQRRGRHVPSGTELACLRSKLPARKWDADVAALNRSGSKPAA